jgi:hypothetical protein
VTGRGRYTLGRLAVALDCESPFWSDIDAVSSLVITGGPQALG